MDNRTLQAALIYAEKLDWSIIPLHGINAGRCTCGQPNCSSAGKHPLTQNGVKDATKDLAVIKQWFNRWPQANIGVACGKISGLFVLDIDPRHGGTDSLYSLIAEYGELPATVTANTGGNGIHFYFKYPENVTVSSKIGFRAGLDIKSDGGFVVLPPSIHISGKRYEWQKGHNPLEMPLADPPDWLINLIVNNSQRFGQAKPPEYWQRLANGVKEGERNNAVAELTGHLLRHGIDPLAVVSLVYAWNITFNKPPLPEDELMRTINSISSCELKKLQRRLS